MLANVLPDIDYQIDKLSMVSKCSFFPAVFISVVAYFLISTRSSFIELWLLLIITFISFSVLLFLIDSNYKFKKDFDESFLNVAIKGRSIKNEKSLIMSLTREIEHRLDIPKVSHIFYNSNTSAIFVLISLLPNSFYP